MWSKNIHYVGDGCCLFRSLSHQLFSSEDQHSFIRELLQRFENLNEAVFSPFLMELNAKEFKDHIHQLSIPWSMGTHIELLAFATYFKAPIYIAQKMGRGHNWRVVKPLSVNASLRFPFLTEDLDTPNIDSLQFTHVEITYENLHYNSLVGINNESTTALPVPKILPPTDVTPVITID